MREGYTVVLAGRRQEMLDAVAKEGAQTPGAALTVQTDVADPASIKALFAKTKATYGRLRPLVQQCRHRHAGHLDRGHAVRQMAQAVVATNLTGAVPVHPGSDQDHESAKSTRRPHHQQRFHLRAHAAAGRRRSIRRPSTPSPGSPNKPRSTAGLMSICCGQVRHRQCRDPAHRPHGARRRRAAARRPQR